MKIDCSIKGIDRISKLIKKKKEYKFLAKISILIMFIISFAEVYFIGELLIKDQEIRIFKTIFGYLDIIAILYIVCSPIILLVFIPIFIITFWRN